MNAIPHYQDLLTRFLQDEVTAEEIRELFNFIEQDPVTYGKLLQQESIRVLVANTADHSNNRLSVLADARIKDNLLLYAGQAPIRRIPVWKKHWLRYAAILLLIAGSSTYLYLQSDKPQKNAQIPSQQSTDIPPGGNHASLILSDGTTIILDSAAMGPLAQQGGIRILKTDAGALAYSNGSKARSIGNNTLSTPAGGQYKVQLSDGTNVWLNAASSITYPALFSGNSRMVTITGEAYFEVAADKTKPFIVRTPTDVIHVLGTSFNVNAYADEPAVRTTLVEGAIKVNKSQLKPREAISGGEVMRANVDREVAWKNGFIYFEGKPIEQIMREIARWYDIEVVYQQGIPNIKLGGKMGRNVSLSGLIAGLEAMELHVELAGRRLKVFAK